MDNYNVLNRFIDNPVDPELNFGLGFEYEQKKQYAGAVSHYLRAAEYGNPVTDRLLIYEALIRMSICFRTLGQREHSESCWLLHAISIAPERPEAWWLLSLHYEHRQQWHEAYTAACAGFDVTAQNHKKLKTDIGYEGQYVLMFQMAVTAWYTGKSRRSRELFYALPDLPLNDYYRQLVQNNISYLGTGENLVFTYTKENMNLLMHKFPGLEAIEHNHSQVFQDLFALTMLNGKRDGWYLEIGSGDPVHISNTYLMETQFGWKGLSVDKWDREVEKFQKVRKNPCVCRDAGAIDYETLLGGFNAPAIIDYLQLDCEPPGNTFKVLMSIPFDKYQFRVITYEHDYFADAFRRYRDLSRQYLTKMGYVLVVNNVAPDDWRSFEDWWVHPSLVDAGILAAMQCVDEKVKNAETYIYGGLKSSPLAYRQAGSQGERHAP